MKKMTFVLGMAFLVSPGFERSGKGSQRDTFISGSLQEDSSPYACLIQSDAERILGQPAQPTEKVSEKEGSVVKHKCVYQAASPDPKTGRPSNLYYMLELYSDAASAHDAYTGMLAANTRMPGQSTMDDIGDEAWLHSDGENFHLLMFRKGNKMVRIKVNKVTTATSLDELRNVVKGISVKI